MPPKGVGFPDPLSGTLKRNDPSADATLASERDEFHSIPEIGQALDEAVFLPLLAACIEVVGAEVLVHGSVLEHVIDGGEDRGGDGHDRLLDAGARADAVELRWEVAARCARRGPGALHQCGREPG